MPIVYPGFSWRNLALSEKGLARHTAYGAIPRFGGEFYWELIYSALTAGSEMLYVAMFDEIDEGTAIFKISDNPPLSNDAHFMDLEGVSSDHYLWLTGKAGKMLRKEIPLEETMPNRELTSKN